jgi:hypothetical protein
VAASAARAVVSFGITVSRLGEVRRRRAPGDIAAARYASPRTRERTAQEGR